MRALVVLLAILGASALPAGAAAATYAPPGNAGVQQYLDPFPSSGGDVAAHGSTGARTGTGASGSLPAGLAHRLARQGAAGAAVARLIAANPVAGRSTGRASGRGSGATASASASASAGKLAPIPLTAAPRSGLSQVLDAAVTGAGGVGVLLPLALAAALGVVVAGVVRGRRRTNS